MTSRLSQTLASEDTERLADRIESLGSPALPSIFTCLRDGVFLVEEDDQTRSQGLTMEQTEALLSAVRNLPPLVISTYVREITTQEPTLPNRRTGLRLMVFAARTNDLGYCMQLAEPTQGEESVDYDSEQSFGLCIERALRNSNRAFRSMRSLYQRAHPQLRSVIVHAIAEVGTEEGFHAMGELLGIAPVLDRYVLSSMSRVSGTVALPIDEPILIRIRELEQSGDPELVREALLILGRVEDADSVPKMIARLSDPEDKVRKAAHWSLKHISDLGLRDDPKRWELWHSNELDWWQDHASEVLTWLRSHRVFERKRAIAVISQRKLRRHELAAELLPLLADPEDSVVILAARALALLDSANAVPALQELAMHPSESVRASGEAALDSLGALEPVRN